ncbi:hypothetical protein C8R46DRAFT_1063720, partial [Mycena filopes]
MTPVGVVVYLEASGLPMGTINTTSATLPLSPGGYDNVFPVAFQHDRVFSLIKAPKGLNMVVPSWHPKFAPRFARPEAALAYRAALIAPKPPPAFLLRHPTQYYERIDGVDYRLVDEKDSLRRALIWRTTSDDTPPVGSVLCLGSPTDKTVQALVFQNFESDLSDEKWWTVEGSVTGVPAMAKVNGGYFLPDNLVENAKINITKEEDSTSTLSYDTDTRSHGT